MADFSWERRVRILEKFHYGSSTKEQPFKRWRPKRGLTMESTKRKSAYWEKLVQQIGRK